ncbi:ATP-binding protein [Methylophaga sp. OBS4]|uniref:ATP-binding protein n=1 Tax=Methylophaga sp. OBS4 TaxID=2991935 RepID=UPI002259BFB3|nr:ATP-binding protein [Methylophaga sp. OBS4]MCX4186353.1 ATP-binding protein [Methylophaga sp. OBS4]
MTELLHILHLEDDADDAYLVQIALDSGGIPCEMHVAASREQFLDTLHKRPLDLILSDSSIPGFSGLSALKTARKSHPDIPFVFVSGYVDQLNSTAMQEIGGAGYVPKTDLGQLVPTIKQILSNPPPTAQTTVSPTGDNPVDRLINIVQALSMARNLDTVMNIVRRAARDLTGADGATFILRERDLCFYAEEDAIAPLWKGKRFPMSACISGWVMMNKQPAIIEDIYTDARIPADAYRPTFVKSLAVVPIRSDAPIGAIGTYWAVQHHASPQQVKLLQSLANSTAIAMENVQLYNELEQRVDERTAQLHELNSELEAFSYSISHDLRAHLRHIDGFSQLLLADSGKNELNETSKAHIARISHAGARMNDLIDDLLKLSQITRSEVSRSPVDVSQMAHDIVEGLQAAMPERRVTVTIAPGMKAEADKGLLRVVLENLFANAWKYTGNVGDAQIRFGINNNSEQQAVFFVQDNGAGFDMSYADKLFAPFQRFHAEKEFPGNGIGLATVQRIIRKHNGRIWADASQGKGATFFFTLGQTASG